MNIFTSSKKILSNMANKMLYFIKRKAFIAKWSEVLSKNAQVYTGIFASLQRVSDGTSKKPGNVIKEWCYRTEYNIKSSGINKLCKTQLLPLLDKNDMAEYAIWASLLLTAAKNAGINPDNRTTFKLDEASIVSYIEWDENEIFIGDEVSVLHPAWYQNGITIEQGHCSKIQK